MAPRKLPRETCCQVSDRRVSLMPKLDEQTLVRMAGISSAYVRHRADQMAKLLVDEPDFRFALAVWTGWSEDDPRLLGLETLAEPERLDSLTRDERSSRLEEAFAAGLKTRAREHLHPIAWGDNQSPDALAYKEIARVRLQADDERDRSVRSPDGDPGGNYLVACEKCSIICRRKVHQANRCESCERSRRPIQHIDEMHKRDPVTGEPFFAQGSKQIYVSNATKLRASRARRKAASVEP